MGLFRGTYTALITPFAGDGVDFAALERLVDRQVDAGVDGLVPCGTTGESPTLSESEHDEVVLRVVRQVRGRCKVLAGAGSACTATAMRFARHAADAGADGVLVVNPYYNRPTQAGLAAHFSAVARATPLPVMLYNIPGRTGVNLDNATISRLFDTARGIVAVKHATGRVDDASDLMQSCPIDLLSGDDPITLPLMILGAVGVVSVLSNLVPAHVKRLTSAGLAGDWASAQRVHRELQPLARSLLSLETNPIPIKTVLAMRGLCREEFRLPMTPIAEENRARLRATLDACSDLLGEPA